MALISDPTNAGFNCYVSYADAVAIAGDFLYAENWTAATQATREKALMLATASLDRYFVWTGEAAVNTQPLDWPRLYVQVADRYSGTYFASNTVPDIIKRATVEYAETLLGENLALDAAGGLDSLKVGPIELDFNAMDRKEPVPPSVRQLLKPYGAYSAGKAATLTLARA